LEQLLQTGDHIGVPPIAIAKEARQMQVSKWGNSLAVITAESPVHGLFGVPASYRALAGSV